MYCMALTISKVKSKNPMAFDRGTKRFFGITMSKVLKGKKSGNYYLLERYTEPSVAYNVRELEDNGKFTTKIKRFNTVANARAWIDKN